ncbi:MAG: Plug domain-containing protein [Candidatus Omnitrophica bacterium]|nr:Plug domain-containing protein [Candidatus Omnitrophota bacterium]
MKNPPPPRVSPVRPALASLLAAAVSLCLGASAAGQSTTTVQDQTAPAPEERKIQLPLEAAEEEEPVQLSPFTVTAEADRGYQATSTLAGTRLRTELRDVGAAISVVNAQFLADTASTNAKDVLVYTTGTEAAGMGGNFSGVATGQGFSNPEDGLVSPNTATRVRGLSGADLTRDFFLTNIPMDSYNTERVDISRGANAILSLGCATPS